MVWVHGLTSAGRCDEVQRFAVRCAVIFGIQGGLEVERVSEVEPGVVQRAIVVLGPGQPACAFSVG